MIYDCFTFFNELELLELRLNELSGVVDKFVLVEATKTHFGLPKPLNFAENRQRFSAFLDRIIHVVVDDDMPTGDGARDHWKRERFQRNAIGRGLKNCLPQDIVMVSDIDEIPNVQTVAQFCRTLHYQDNLLSNIIHTAFNSRLTRFLFHRKCLRHFLRKNNPFVWKLEQHPCSFFLNRTGRDTAWWYGTKIMHYRDFSVADEMRYSGYKIIKNGGWHFTYMGDANRIKSKVAAMAHQEINTPEMIEQFTEQTTMAKVAHELEQGNIKLIPHSELPNYVIEHPEKFSGWLIDPMNLPHTR